jgi:hypothetical protein
VAIANPLKVKAIAEAETKTDKVDAEVLAQLLRCKFLPEVWIPDGTTRVEHWKEAIQVVFRCDAKVIPLPTF